ncbi:MAG: hypothetical protein ACM3PY_14440, partial [Omnitrophica WOR_2 bacterium]
MEIGGEPPISIFEINIRPELSMLSKVVDNQTGHTDYPSTRSGTVSKWKAMVDIQGALRMPFSPD